MKYLRLFSLIIPVSLGILGGCDSAPETKTPEKAIAEQVKFQIAPIDFDDPAPIFAKLFPNNIPIGVKNELETTSEYRARLAMSGIEGREYTFLIPPTLCEVQAFPDLDFYVITSKDSFLDYSKTPYGITVLSVETKGASYTGQNAFGASAEISVSTTTLFKVAPGDYSSLPVPVRWQKSPESFDKYFGLPIKIADPSFRQRLRDKQIGLAVRVRIGDLTKLDRSLDFAHEATISEPESMSQESMFLPVTILRAWIVDLTTKTSIVTWDPTARFSTTTVSSLPAAVDRAPNDNAPLDQTSGRDGRLPLSDAQGGNAAGFDPAKMEGWKVENIDLQLLPVSSGTFVMGNGHGNERPTTRVTLTKPFWLGKTAVTQAQYESVMGNNPSRFKGPDLPVDSVSWESANSFCQKLTLMEKTAGRLPEGYGFSLPTEAQREFASTTGGRSEDKGTLESRAWYGSILGSTHPVALKEPTAWGFYDMEGNVYEWCSDWYGDYLGGDQTDPKGPATGTTKVIRGGAWNCPAMFCGSTFRYRHDWESGQINIGFRVMLSGAP
jgi:formylglycine-generating enzyme required for sulfatase activity